MSEPIDAILNTLPVHSVPAMDFICEDRTRAQLGPLEDFAKKLKDDGQLNPITYEWIEREGHRVRKIHTGGRRFYAAALLSTRSEFFGMHLPEGNPRRVAAVGHILARDIGDLDDITRLKLELSENNDREAFTKAENALGYAKLQKLMESKLGRPVSITELATELNQSVGQIGMGIRVAQAINKDPNSELSRNLISQPSVKAAYTHLGNQAKLGELKRRAESATRNVDTYEKALGHEDGIAFLRALPAESIDFIHYDPPWGVGIDEYDRHHKHENFDDSPEYAWDSVITPMIPELYRVLKVDTWSVVWFGIQFYERLAKALETLNGKVKPGKAFTVDPVPGIWYKTNKGGSQNNPDIVELNVYESFLRIRKGNPRLFKKPLKNLIECPMDYGADRDHYAQKPVALSRELLERYSFGNMHVIDPTYGSGRFFVAARGLGRVFSGAEKSKVNREKALAALREVK